MRLVLRRATRTEKSVIGHLTLAGIQVCDTLENAHKKIPAGLYPIVLYHSPRFGMEVPLLEQVEGRSCIEIHPANAPEELQGCIAVGQDIQVPDFISGSRQAFRQLMTKLQPSFKAGEPIEIEVLDA